MNSRRPHHFGLTLVEVLLAMAIMAMVLAALAQLQDSGARAALKATLTAEASVICQSEMDAWLAGDRDSAALDSVEPLPGIEPWSRRYSLQPLPSTSEQSALSLLTVEVFRGRQATPVFVLSRWVPARNQEGLR